MWTQDKSFIAGALMPLLKDSPHWDDRWNIAGYVSLCMMQGFCKTEEQARECAKRYMIGKRKVSPPGTKRKKRAASMRRKQLKNVPQAALDAVKQAAQTPAAQQVRDGNLKAINSLVGMVLKASKIDAAVAKELLMVEINEHQ